MLRPTTRVCHTRQDIALGEIRREEKQADFQKDPARWAATPKFRYHLHNELEEKLNNVNASRSMIQSLVQQELVQYEMISNRFSTDLQVQHNTYKNEFLNWHQRLADDRKLLLNNRI